MAAARNVTHELRRRHTETGQNIFATTGAATNRARRVTRSATRDRRASRSPKGSRTRGGPLQQPRWPTGAQCEVPANVGLVCKCTANLISKRDFEAGFKWQVRMRTDHRRQRTLALGRNGQHSPAETEPVHVVSAARKKWPRCAGLFVAGEKAVWTSAVRRSTFSGNKQPSLTRVQ